MVKLLSPSSVSRRDVLLLRLVFLLSLAFTAALFVHRSWHWSLDVDSPIMHYVTFLMDHGMRPYQEITDNNMPGVYLTESWAMHVFGRFDFGWRLYDYALLAGMTAAMAVITAPYDWLGGVFAGGVFALMHGAEGPWFAGEREEVLTVLMVVACAFLFLSERRQRPVLTGLFGFFAGMAASVKPTVAPFAVVVLGLLALRLRREGRAVWPSMLWGVGGLGAVAALNVGFLLWYGSLRSFWFVLHTITPAYVSLNQRGWRYMMAHSLPRDLLPILLFGLLAWALHRFWNWEKTVVLMGAGFGLFSYLAQHKGFYYHRYVFVAFLLLMAGIELLHAAQRSGWLRVVGCVGLLIPVFGNFPDYSEQIKWRPRQNALTVTMERDLRTLGVDRLQGQVQCFDMVFGCLNSLYHLGLVENTGYTGDMLLFQQNTTVATTYYQNMFWRAEAAHPADVFVITNEYFGGENSFSKIDHWPEFRAYLAQNYTLAVARVFPYVNRPPDQPMPLETARAYRIYVRKGSALMEPALEVGRRGPFVVK